MQYITHYETTYGDTGSAVHKTADAALREAFRLQKASRVRRVTVFDKAGQFLLHVWESPTLIDPFAGL
jgi:hypothetical protein